MPGASAPALDEQVVQEQSSVDYRAFARTVRVDRLRILQNVALVASIYYVIEAATQDAWYSCLTHGAGWLLFVLSIVVLRRWQQHRIASWIYLGGLNCALGVTAIFADSIHSLGLWLISLLPMVASCLLSRRDTLAVTLVALVEIIGLALIEPWAHQYNEVTDTDFDIALLLTISLATHALVAYLASTFLNKQARIVEEQHAEVEKAHRRAERADEAKSKFLARMSHEIRTPMNAILGMTQHLMKEEIQEDSRRAIETVDRCGENLLALLNDILDWSSVENGDIELLESTTNIVRLIQDTRDLFVAQAQLKNLEIVVRSQREAYWCKCDEKRMRQVLCNLVGNAIKFSDEGQIILELSITPSTDSSPSNAALRSSLALSVIDQGIGMTPEQQSRVFQQFAQADTANARSRGGTGLGLAISADIIQKMGGNIALESEINKGSTFRIEIEVEESDPPASNHSVLGDPTQSQIADANCSILIVDDIAVNREVLALALMRVGIAVHQAESGKRAIELCKEQSFDLIFMDIRMPDLDGMQTTRAIKEQAAPNRDTPIVALSANAYAQDREAALASGMVEHLAKPFRVQEILRILGSYVPRMAEELRDAS